MKSFFTLFIIMQLVMLPFAFIDQIPFVVRFFEIKKDMHLEEFQKNQAIFFLSVVLLTPPIEEFISRFYMDKVNYIVTLIFSGLGITLYFITNYKEMFFWSVFIFVTLVVTVKVTTLPYFNERLALVQQKYFRFVFYFSAVLFGMVHVMNYSIFGIKSLLAFVLVIPQVIGGLQLGYLRLRYGISTAIATHMLNNLIGFLIYFLFY